MDIIHILPQAVSNQLSAEELIQRPSSVIKELMENALDAGAGCIDVYVSNAGLNSIQVLDNGKGMSSNDARLAFERHATSKISGIDDLTTLHTMGFRGVALSCIAAVSEVTMQTCTPDSEVGTRIDFAGGEFKAQEPCMCQVGTNIDVKNLFYNAGNKRRFLKSNITELRNIKEEFLHIALVNPSVSFTLTSDGNRIWDLQATQSARQRIRDLFSKSLSEKLLEVNVDSTIARITGFVGRPESAVKARPQQYLFVNGRFMRHAYFTKAVQEAFDRLIPAGEQVPFFLFIQVDPADIDVNLSPTKTEIKFNNDSDIFRLILVGIKEALGKFNAVPIIDFTKAQDFEIPVYNSTAKPVSTPSVKVDTDYNPFKTTASAQDWTKLYDDLLSQTPEKGTKVTEDSFFGNEGSLEDETSTHYYQYKGQYIVVAARSGLMIVDQHRAHIRILYDRYIGQMKNRQAPAQGCLFPELIELGAQEQELMEAILPDLQNLGFDIVPLGAGSYSVNGIPADVDLISARKIIQEMLNSLQDGIEKDADEYKGSIALAMAKNTCIVTGQVLSTDEMDSIMSSLLQSSNPNLTPDGKTVIKVITDYELSKLFN
ncbi:MAG: DNA mismatch repair endonuclease MutL [Bacteroidaceae bacterium]|nr:DNA mismatch repair endonuclease MutL [Bacteroidaceae bacterium]